MQQSLTKNPNLFWHLLKTKILFLEKINFSSVFTENSYDNSEQAYELNVSNVMVNINEITYDDISNAIKKLKSNFTCGLDRMPAFLAGDCSDVLNEPLYIIFNQCIQSSEFPTL